jgi:hypothetical protein
MKKTTLLFIIFFGLVNAYAQDGVADKIAKQAVEIDSLKKANKTVLIKNDSLRKTILANESSNNQQSTNYKASKKKYADTIVDLKKELVKLEKYKSNKKAIEATLVAKSDSIVLLKKQITQRDNEIKNNNEKSKKDAAIENQNGKNEILNQIVNMYKNKNFDDLINSTNLTSIQRDKQLIGNNTDVKQIISDLEIYFIAENLFSKKFNESQVKNYKSQVDLLKQQSKFVDVLKDNLDNFKTFNDGLNATIQNIIAIDKKEIVKGMSEQVVKSKLNKILSELSKFIFDYNFNFVDYPYFSDIILEIIKRKQPNPDADISDLLKKVE